MSTRPVDVLADVPAFAGCSRNEIRRIARYTLDQQHPPGTVLVEEGTDGDEFYVVVEGTVEVLQGGEIVNTLGPGQFFGEVALLGHATRNATIRTASPARLLVVSARSFRSLIGRYPVIFDQVVAALEERA
jgi:CRP/FNR family transcriptional regulator, cyclic AMP receptor protein